MKSLKKGLSVLLSLVLCGSMVIPAFAATFTDLQEAISDTATPDTEDKTSNGTELGDGRQGYAWNGEAENWGIEAWDEGDTRHVQVNENVSYDEKVDNSNKSIIINSGTKVDVTMKEDVSITGTKDASVIIVSGSTDPDGKYSPAPGELEITGGTITNVPQEGSDGNADKGTDPISPENSVIYVGTNAELTLDDTDVIGGEDTQSGIYAGPGADVTLTGGATVSNKGGDDIYLDYGDTGFYVESGENDGASINTPKGGSWVDSSGDPVSANEKGIVTSDKPLGLTWKPNSGSNNEGGGGTSNEVEITDPDVPLAEGPVTAAEFIHKMWVLDGEPAPLDDRGLPQSVDEDHEYAPAIAWAASADIVPVDSFDAEALLTVALAREYLTNFAAYADMAMPELTALTGKDSDLVMNSDDVLDEFFGEKDSE